MLNNCNWIVPEWPAPFNVKALTTTRRGGYSLAPYDSFNLAIDKGDDPQTVLANRELLKAKANLPSEPFWLKQVHSTAVVEAGTPLKDAIEIEADAAVAFQPNQVCVVMSGDCLPIILCNQTGTCVGAVHAGWKGLAAGVIEAALKKLDCDPATLLAWLGPAIGPEKFEVKEDVFLAFNGYQSAKTFRPAGNKGVWFANLYELAKERLKRLGVTGVFGGGFCTYQDTERFYSFRRSKITGRMATLIWFTSP